MIMTGYQLIVESPFIMHL